MTPISKTLVILLGDIKLANLDMEMENQQK